MSRACQHGAFFAKWDGLFIFLIWHIQHFPLHTHDGRGTHNKLTITVSENTQTRQSATKRMRSAIYCSKMKCRQILAHFGCVFKKIYSEQIIGASG